jgi:hypothetical protein
MDWDDPALIERRDALKQAYSHLQPYHPSLPPTLKDFQVFLGKIAGQVTVCDKFRQTSLPLLSTVKTTPLELLPYWDGQNVANAPYQLPLAKRCIAATNFREGCSIMGGEGDFPPQKPHL